MVIEITGFFSITKAIIYCPGKGPPVSFTSAKPVKRIRDIK
jgi:hypothetical protein